MQLAKAVRRSQTWVSKCALGERRVDFVELEDLAKALGKKKPKDGWPDPPNEMVEAEPEESEDKRESD